MANLTKVFQDEWNRHNPADWSKIHLFKMGTFWRAYEWSAWLISCVTFNKEAQQKTHNKTPIHVTRMMRTDVENETYCFVGFPLKSVEKFIPVRTNYESISDTHVVITIALPKPSDNSEVTFERIADAISTWKDTIEIKQKEKQKKTPAALSTVHEQSSQQVSGGLIATVMQYRIEAHTEQEHAQFIKSLQSLIVSIL